LASVSEPLTARSDEGASTRERGLMSIGSKIAEKWHERRDPVTDWIDDPWDDPAATYFDSVELLRKRRRVLPRIAFGVAVVLIAAVLVGGGVGLWYLRQVNPPAGPGEAKQFQVEAGDTLESVSTRLHDQGFITNAGVFEYYVKEHGGLDFVPGSYTIHPDDHAGNVMRVLSTPPSETYIKITFPEGFTVAQMANRVAQQIPTMTAEAFMAAAAEHAAQNPLLPPGSTSLEGALFPDTYYVSGAETESHLIGRMEGLMDRVSSQLGFAPGTPDIDPYQKLIIASIIEKEAKTAADRPKIARVIYNRLYLQMPLQIDATLIYGQAVDPSIDQTLSPGQLRDIDSPYNSYTHVGLPPTPISNPGRASLEAAMNPAPTLGVNDPLCKGLAEGQPCALLYYVLADKDGNHDFAVTYDQHLANIAKAQANGIAVG
jgi:UPF0755 protein